MPLAKVKILIIFIFSGAMVLTPVYANDAFNEFARAILKKAPKFEVEALINKYQGQDLNGQAYVVSIGEDLSGDTLVNLSTRSDFTASDAVSLVVFLRKYLAGHKLKIKQGQRVRFMGIFEEIRMDSIILKEGVIK